MDLISIVIAYNIIGICSLIAMKLNTELRARPEYLLAVLLSAIWPITLTVCIFAMIYDGGSK
jgi:hypothetical protein